MNEILKPCDGAELIYCDYKFNSLEEKEFCLGLMNAKLRRNGPKPFTKEDVAAFFDLAKIKYRE